MKLRIIWAVTGLLIAALIALALHRGWPLLFPSGERLAPLDPGCDLRAGPCLARFPGGGLVRLAIAPPTLPAAEPLTLRVETEGLAPTLIEVDFAGTDMDMGFNRVALAAAAPEVYTGRAMLPVCARARMEWEAKVMLHMPDGLWIAPFRFETTRAGRHP
ncbi:hypothetical protein [Thiococcus pfennigii]|jgi:hypothetical protein|uniref:hypothetical protein n=1 Tax=Thiococcus pfennigii TaxID=1057 RepID=UPI001905FDD7|nr:hypothetical protein [Thiococcus pfennigii]MBK1700418.1 hypothetical protein [Thiococcus pfennigii]MBK1731270.1 hypothetical protein [Thiococcus pfennigii]